MQGKLKKIGNEYKLYAQDDSCIATSWYSPYQRLSKNNCEAIVNGYDLDELAEEEAKKRHDWNKHRDTNIYNELVREDAELIKIGMQKALEILGDKKFSEDDMGNAIEMCIKLMNDKGSEFREHKQTVIRSLQQTEWDVEICCYIGNGDEESDSFKDPLVTNTCIPKLDAYGCLILKRK